MVLLSWSEDLLKKSIKKEVVETKLMERYFQKV